MQNRLLVYLLHNKMIEGKENKRISKKIFNKIIIELKYNI